MIQTIHLFATLKEIVGATRISVELDEPATVATLVDNLIARYPALKPISQNILISVNQNFAGYSQVITSEDEIALFPPVSGG
jgi:molybdopterin converting factor subunit 1